MEPGEAERRRFSSLSEEEMQNLIEGKDSENTRKATKNAVVTFRERSLLWIIDKNLSVERSGIFH